MALPTYPTVQRGASLMLAFRMQSKLTLIVGSNRLAATRAFSALDADSRVIVLARGGVETACEELKRRAEQGELEIHDLDVLAGPSDDTGRDHDALAINAFLSEQSPSLVCITDTLLSAPSCNRRSRASATQIYNACRARGIPTNVTDIADLCDFTFCSAHRAADLETGKATPLQVAVTTNGHGCRLAARFRREIVAALPRGAGVAAEKVGRLRNLAKEVGGEEIGAEVANDADGEVNEEITVDSPNRPVPQRVVSAGTKETEAERTRRRMKWVAQISEYWPTEKLASLTDEGMAELLNGDLALPKPAPSPTQPNDGSIDSTSVHSLDVAPLPQGRILLVGSGPGHPSLLTLAAHTALTQLADLVLTDKLVPAAVLTLIPPHVEVRVARKFPGNAEGAQMEMMDAALEAARNGKTVVRLKQGDPMLYGRAGEEVLFFRAHGFEALVVPGVTSALAAPLLAGIPPTQRGVSESLIISTGVGRRGRAVALPAYERGRTLVLLMGVARLAQVREALLGQRVDKGASYPAHLPIALVERGSMPDQRVVATTLQHVLAAVDSIGEQRPPGLLVVGWTVLALWGEGDVTVLDGNGHEPAEGKASGPSAKDDAQRVERWLGGKSWLVKEGLDPSWSLFNVPQA